MNIVPTRREVLDDVNDRLDSLTSTEVDRIFRRVSVSDLIILLIALDKLGKNLQSLNVDE